MKVQRWFEKYKIVQEGEKFLIQRQDGTFWTQKFNSYESAKSQAIANTHIPKFDRTNYEKMKIAKQINE